MRHRVVVRSSLLLGLALVLVLAARSGTRGAAIPSAQPAGGAALRSPEPDGRGARFSSAGLGGMFASSLGDAASRPARARAKKDAGLTFAAPVYVTSDANTQGAEPSIRVDRNDPNQRIWVTAPTGIGANVQPLVSAGGDLFWRSDDDGQTWTVASTVAGVGSPTIIGGGDTDVAPRHDNAVFGTGLTLANVTLAASCDGGSTWTTNPLSTAGTIEDRQWIDAYQDRDKPLGAPDFVLDIGLADLVSQQQNQRVVFYQVLSPACNPPSAGPPIDTALPTCPAQPPLTADCYQWPGSVAIDELTGDAYVTYNTLGSDDLTPPGPSGDDKVVVARIDGGGSAPGASQLDAHVFTAAANRPDTFDSFTVVALDQAGTVYVVWNERHPNAVDASLGQTAVMYAYSKDHGATWSSPIQVNQVPTTTFPWIVAGSAGRIDIVYYGTDATGPSPQEVPGTSQWKVYMAQSLNADTASPTFSETVASPVVHQGFICTSGTGCASGTRDLLDYFQVDVDAEGLANIAYTDNFVHGTNQTWVTFVQQNGGSSLFGPTAVTVRSFDARRGRGGVELRWRTASEVQLLGFNVYRGTRRLNRSLIPAGGRRGAYSFVDRAAKGAAATYRLQLVSTDGVSRWYGAARVSAR